MGELLNFIDRALTRGVSKSRARVENKILCICKAPSGGCNMKLKP